ncbi:MAG: diguanylate cyclase [Bacillota bacterium]
MVNDNYGHDEGDKALMLVADTANKCLRRVDTVARFGGEEFLAILVLYPWVPGILIVAVPVVCPLRWRYAGRNRSRLPW